MDNTELEREMLGLVEPLLVQVEPAPVALEQLGVIAQRGRIPIVDLEHALVRIDGSFNVVRFLIERARHAAQQLHALPRIGASLDAALAWQPDEIFLYPLYVRPLTGLARFKWPWRVTPNQQIWCNRVISFRCGPYQEGS